MGFEKSRREFWKSRRDLNSLSHLTKDVNRVIGTSERLYGRKKCREENMEFGSGECCKGNKSEIESREEDMGLGVRSGV